MKQLRTSWHRTLFALLCLSIAGCSSVQKSLSLLPGISDPDTTKIRSISVSTNAAGNANQNSAIQMDVLFIMDKNLTATLPATAAEWFNNRSRYLTNNSSTILPVPVSLPPDGNKHLSLPKGYQKAQDVIAYANYLSDKGQKWLRLINSKSVSIELDKLDWTLAEANQ